MTENNRIEYKRELTDSLEKEVIAFLNAVVHNDYSYGATPKLEFFSDRAEVTSMGGLPYGITEADFFGGCSVPRNKEIMRILRDLEIVEHLGSGVPRILKAYGRDAFEIRDSFLRIVLPYSEPLTPQVTPHVTPHVPPHVQSLLDVLKDRMSRAQLMEALSIKDASYFNRTYLKPALKSGVIEMTLPDKPRSRLQKYYAVSPDFTELRTPHRTPLRTPHGTPHVLRLLEALHGSMSRLQLMAALSIEDASYFNNTFLKSALEAGLIEMTIPEKPTSRLQKYRLTEKGRALLQQEGKQ